MVEPPCPREGSYYSQIIHVLQYIDMFKSKTFNVLRTISMCTTSLHSKFCKIVLWNECTRIVWMDYLLQIILHH